MEPTGKTAGECDVPKWVYKLFTGHAYPYVRRQAKFAFKREPTPEDIKQKFGEIFPHCWLKVLQEIKTGMIVTFVELGRYEAGAYQELIDHPDEFLARTYGKKKIKLNFYLGENFVCTINFKVAGWISHDEEGTSLPSPLQGEGKGEGGMPVVGDSSAVPSPPPNKKWAPGGEG